MLAKEDKKCEKMKTSNVILFNSKRNSIFKTKEKYNSIPHYHEMAEGEFSIQSEDQELLKAFENIRKSIKK